MKKISGVMKNALFDLKPGSFRTEPEEKHECQRCNDRGLILKDGYVVKCSCIKGKQALKHKFAFYGDTLQKASFDNFDIKFYATSHLEDDPSVESEGAAKAIRGAKQFVQEIINGAHPKGLMFTGNVGSGKTHLAASITNALRNKGVEVLFVVVPDLLDEMRASYNSEEINESDIMDAAKNAPVLILDDLGAHNYTDWTRNKIFSLLNYRLTHLLPVVITTNLNMGELEEYLGERTTSRIVELCSIYRLNVFKDIRFQKNLKK